MSRFRKGVENGVKYGLGQNVKVVFEELILFDAFINADIIVHVVFADPI